MISQLPLQLPLTKLIQKHKKQRILAASPQNQHYSESEQSSCQQLCQLSSNQFMISKKQSRQTENLCNFPKQCVDSDYVQKSEKKQNRPLINSLFHQIRREHQNQINAQKPFKEIQNQFYDDYLKEKIQKMYKNLIKNGQQDVVQNKENFPNIKNQQQQNKQDHQLYTSLMNSELNSQRFHQVITLSKRIDSLFKQTQPKQTKQRSLQIRSLQNSQKLQKVKLQSLIRKKLGKIQTVQNQKQTKTRYEKILEEHFQAQAMKASAQSQKKQKISSMKCMKSNRQIISDKKLSKKQEYNELRNLDKQLASLQIRKTFSEKVIKAKKQCFRNNLQAKVPNSHRKLQIKYKQAQSSLKKPSTYLGIYYDKFNKIS